MTKIVKASEFEANCRSIMDEVAATGQGVVVVKDGKPILDIVPHTSEPKPNLFGLFKDDLVIKGDIISPIDVEWDANK